MKGRDIVCIGGVDFDPLWARIQELMWRFSAENRVLYTETPISLLSPLKDPSLTPKLTAWTKGIKERRPGLYLYSPPPQLPMANKSRLINRINQMVFAAFLRRQMNRLGFKRPLLYLTMPNSVDLLGRIEADLVVYDCLDEYSAFEGLLDPVLVTQMEEELMVRSDVVMVVSQPLYESKGRCRPDVEIVRNAADYDLFSRALEADCPVPEDIAGLQGPVVGFIGRMKEWIDTGAIEYIARHRPQYQVVLVGPVENDFDGARLGGLTNVHMVGARSRAELPGYLKRFDVCLNPFRPTELSMAANPLKLYEYLASGRPVVSTPMPEAALMEGLVYVADGGAALVEAIDRALAEGPAGQARRLEFARENSWEARLAAISRLCEAAAAAARRPGGK